MNTIDPSEWLSLAEIARRLPSPVLGKKTHVSTVHRIARRHGLPMLRRGHYRFLRWEDVIACFELEHPAGPRERKPRPRKPRELSKEHEDALRRWNLLGLCR